MIYQKLHLMFGAIFLVEHLFTDTKKLLSSRGIAPTYNFEGLIELDGKLVHRLNVQ